MNGFNPSKKNGLILGGIGVFVHLATYAIDPEIFLSQGFGIFSMVVSGLALPLVLMIIASRDCKPNFTPFSFGKAFTSAFLVGLIAISISFTFNIIFNNLIDPEFEEWVYDTKMDEQFDKMEDSGYSEDVLKQIKESTDTAKKYSTGILGSLIIHLVLLTWYTILSLFIGLAQKDNKQADLIA